MPVKKILVMGGVILALGGLTYWAASTVFRGEPAVCQVCARPIHSGQEYTLILIDGTEEHTCCPRCGMHFQITRADRVRTAWATDYTTGEKINPEHASYVEGSDLMTCCSTPPLKRDLESTYELIWDRCLPSLMAFKTKTDADQFQRQHGGRVLAYAEAVQSVKTR